MTSSGQHAVVRGARGSWRLSSSAGSFRVKLTYDYNNNDHQYYYLLSGLGKSLFNPSLEGQLNI